MARLKTVILAGGLGTRLSEETVIRPKPMVELGGRPILWHIMKLYSHFGINDFVVCLGYKGYTIKEYFANYFLHNSDVTFNLADNAMQVHERKTEPWRVTLVDTGETAMTGEHDAAGLVTFAQAAEDAGFDSVWIGDSPLARTRAEPLAVLGAVAASTSRVRIGTAGMPVRFTKSSSSAMSVWLPT